MFQRRAFLRMVSCVLPLLWSGNLFAAADDPVELVRHTAEQIIKTLEQRRSEVERKPALIYDMIDTTVAPHFDFERITQGAMGQNWRQITPDQQRQMVNAFKQVLIRTYARALLSYSGQEIRYQPAKPGSKPSTVTVATEVVAPGAAPIPVDYRMHNGNGRWQVYDVVINNASLVGNYRNSFNDEIRKSGVNGLIAKLGDMNRQGLE